MLATAGIIGVGAGQFAAGLVDLVFLTVAVWQRRYRHGFSLTLVPLAAVVTASVPAWIVANALGNDVLALLASVALGEAIYVAIMMVCRRTVIDSTVRLGRRTFRSFAHAA